MRTDETEECSDRGNKDAITGLLFNPYCENMMIVPKPLLETLMPGDKDTPPFFQEPQ